MKCKKNTIHWVGIEARIWLTERIIGAEIKNQLTNKYGLNNKSFLITMHKRFGRYLQYALAMESVFISKWLNG